MHCSGGLVYFSRNIGELTPKTIYFHYLEECYLDQSIQKIFCFVLKKDALLRWLGVDHVYLTENNSAHPIKEAIADFVKGGFVTYRTESTPFAQIMVYKWCFNQHRKSHNWMAFFDADEYLMIRDKCVPLSHGADQ